MNVRYHVLGTLSPLDGIGPEQLNIRSLVDRVAEAVNATVEGQTTRIISPTNCPVSKSGDLAGAGVPVGGELDYLDEGTLAAALRSRTAF
jgi:recombination protein RecR